MIRYLGLILFLGAGVFMLAGEESAFFAKYAVLCAGGALVYFGASVNNMAESIRKAMLDEDYED